MPAGTDTNYALQVLRGLAAFLVVLLHLSERTHFAFAEINPDVSALPFGDGGGIGVDIFFIISGYIMAKISFDSFGRSNVVGPFMIKRIVRIFPLYFLATALLASLKVAAGNGDGIGFPDFLMSVLFVPYPDGPILAPGWTLNFEMLFYLLFAGALLLPSRHLAISTLTALIVGIWIWGQFENAPAFFDYYGIDRILLFPVGLWLAEAQGLFGRAGRLRVSVPLLVALAVVPLLIVFPNFWVRTLFCLGFVATCVFLADLQPRGVTNRAMITLGDASFSLYLIHPIVFKTVTTVWVAVLGPNYVGAFATVSLVTVLAAAYASYRLIEVPVTALLRRWFLRRPAPAGVPAQGGG